MAGNAATATSATKAAKLTTARTLTIGNTGKSFNGTGDVSWSLEEIGAWAKDNLKFSLSGTTLAITTS